MSRRLAAIAVVALLTSAAWGQNTAERRPVPPPAVPQTLRILNQRLPEVSFRDTPFEQVVEFLADLTKINFVVRWQTLEDAGVKRDAPVSLQVRNLRLSQILWLLMNDVAGSELKLAYRMSGNLLVLSTEDDLDKEMVTKVYDVADLLVRPLTADRNTGFDPTQAMNQGGTQGGGSNSLFGQSSQQNYGNTQGNQGELSNVEMQSLVDLIQDTIEPDTWNRNGGQGSVHAYRHLLVIRNTLLVHQRLGGYVTEGEVGP